MLLGCITLGAALALCVGIQALFGWGRAQLDTGAALSADTLRLHIRAASDTIADQTDKIIRLTDGVISSITETGLGKR